MNSYSTDLKGLTPEQKRALLSRLLRDPGEVAKTYPLSYAQQRLWFLNQIAPGSPYYHQYLTLRLHRPLRVDLLQRALDEIARRHDSLRTTFRAIDGQPVQVVAPSLVVPLAEVDLRHLQGAAREAEVIRLASEEIRQRFHLAEGPLVRSALLFLGEEEYVFVLTMHHIVSDGWSLNIFLKELTALYTAYGAGKGSPLSPLRIQYSDFAVWQRQFLQGAVLDRQLSYWKGQLVNLPVLEIPTDRPRPPLPSLRGGFHSSKLAGSLTAAIKALSQHEGATRFMTLLAAFQLLLCRWTGQEDIVIGVPVANRNRAELEELIGFFTNTLVMRTDLSSNPTFRELLQRVKEVALGAYAHQDLPFEKLVEELQPQRDLSHNPLFQVTFQLFSSPDSTVTATGADHEPLDVGTDSAMFDLVFNLFEGPAGIEVQVEFSLDLFDPETISGLTQRFRILLEGIIADPDERIWALPLLSAEERRQLLTVWNATVAEYPRDKQIHQLVEEQVARTPEALAVIFRTDQMTYRELNRRANQLAHSLRRLGVEPEVPVGVCIERSPEMVVAFLGVLKAGGAYVPLDPAYPDERMAFILGDSGARVLLARRRTVQRLPNVPSMVLCLDTDWPAVARSPDTNLDIKFDPGSLAYVIYTSGSTGKPKGVEVGHRGVVNLIAWHQRAYQVTSSDRATQLASPAFDACVWELWPYLSAGAAIYIPDEESRASPAALIRWLAEMRITIAFLATPLAESVLEVQLPADLCLRALLTGGDMLRGSPRKALPFGLFNHYGPTEYTVVTTSAVVPTCTNEEIAPPIGRPIANTRVFVLDRYGNPVPAGVPGELHIAGDGLARGYRGRPDLTREKFLSNPFSVGTERMYKTGDLVRYRRDGSLEFLGRLDDLVKIRGFRIEPVEIEETLRRHNAVRDAAVVAAENARGEKTLVAYVVPAGPRAPEESELRQFLQQRLPNYMVPSRLVCLQMMPLSPNGKLDRRALPLPNWAAPGKEVVAPRTELERKIAAAWQEVLDLEEVDVHENFFDAGGHSLLMVRLQSTLRQLLQLEISVVDLFRYPTVAALAERLGSGEAGSHSVSDVQQRARKQKEALNTSMRQTATGSV